MLRPFPPSAKYLITAGHCPADDPGSHTFYHNGVAIGTSTVNTLTMADFDSDARRIPATGNTTQMNRVYETNNSKSYPITSVVSFNNQIYRDWVCEIGVGVSTFGPQCGQVINDDTTMSSSGQTIAAKRVDFNGTANSGYGVDGGDSGASVVYNNRLFGSATKLDGRCSLATNIQNDLDVWFCLNADCTVP